MGGCSTAVHKGVLDSQHFSLSPLNPTHYVYQSHDTAAGVQLRAHAALYHPAPLLHQKLFTLTFYRFCLLWLVTPACTGSLSVMEKSSKMIKKDKLHVLSDGHSHVSSLSLCLFVRLWSPSFALLASSSAFTAHLPCIGLVWPGLFTSVSLSAPQLLTASSV